MRKNLYYYEYVNRPYAEVVAAFREHGLEILQPATDYAVASMHQTVVNINVGLGAAAIGADVVIELGEVVEDGWGSHFPIEWKAAEHPALFPSMDAEIEIAPLADPPHPLTQIALVGQYRPPMGIVGALGDVIFGHRLAEASVERFVTDLAKRVAEYHLITA